MTAASYTRCYAPSSSPSWRSARRGRTAGHCHRARRRRAVPGELIVGFEEGVSEAERRQLLRRIGGSEKHRFGQIRGALVTVSPSRRDAVLAELSADPLVRYVEPNYVLDDGSPSPTTHSTTVSGG